MRLSIFVSFTLFVLALAGKAHTQDLDPRSFSPSPVDLNFVLVGYSYSDGNVFLDQSLPAEDATGRLHAANTAYVRTLDFFGASAKLGVLVPFVWGDWEGIWMGEPASTSRQGFGDPVVSLAVNVIGAPALKPKQWRAYNEGTIIGAALTAIVPIGQYDPDKLINLGSNRWAFRTRLGVSRKIGKWTIEGIGAAWFFTKNPDAIGDNSVEQDPIVSIQFNAIHQFRRGIWAGVGFGYGEGGRTTVSGQPKDTRQINRRFGGTIVYPLNTKHSLKLIYINSLSTRIGADFDRVGLFWQMHWGGGL